MAAIFHDKTRHSLGLPQFGWSLFFLFSAVGLLVGGASDTQAAEIVPPGIHAKNDAGAGQAGSRGPSAVFYNPANMIYTRKFEPYADIAFLNLSYSYVHTDEKFTPAVIEVNAPPVTLGASVRLIPSLTFGIAFVPLGTGTATKIENVPIKLPLGNNSDYVALNITRGTTAYKLGAGAAFRVGYPFTIGLGFLRTSEASTLIITDPKSEEVPIVDSQFSGAFHQYVFGARSEIMDRKIVLAGSYRTSVAMVYKGDISLNGAEFEAYSGVGYLPAVLGLGLEARFGNFGVFGDYTREFWSKGRLITKMGVAGEAAETDYLDTNNIVGGGRFWFGKSSVSAAFGYMTPNVGLGTEDPNAVSSGEASPANPSPTVNLQDETEETPVNINGMSFGNMDGLTRMVFSGGYRYHLAGHGYFQGGLYYLSGSRVVPEGFSGQGTYSLRIILASAGVAYGF